MGSGSLVSISYEVLELEWGLIESLVPIPYKVLELEWGLGVWYPFHSRCWNWNRVWDSGIHSVLGVGTGIGSGTLVFIPY